MYRQIKSQLTVLYSQIKSQLMLLYRQIRSQLTVPSHWVRVMVYTVKLFPRSLTHGVSLGQVRSGHTASQQSVVKRKAKHILGKKENISPSASNPRIIIFLLLPKTCLSLRFTTNCKEAVCPDLTKPNLRILHV